MYKFKEKNNQPRKYFLEIQIKCIKRIYKDEINYSVVIIINHSIKNQR